MNADISKALADIFPAVDVLSGEQYAFYGEDESHASKPNLLAVVFPRTHQQVVDVVILANKKNIALVASGGRTGLSGAAVAQNNELVVSFEKMNALLELDLLSRQVSVQAGMTLETLQTIASENSLFYPVDYASKGSAQVGGALATNAGGIRVLRFGMTRDWVAGFKAVTGDGETLSVDRCLVKDNAGYDVKNLLIGSEGTLALITEVTLNLTEPMKEQQTTLLAFDTLQQLIQVFDGLRSSVRLNAAEFFCKNSLIEVCFAFNLVAPFDKSFSYYLLVEFDIDALDLESFAGLLGDTPSLMSQSLEQTKKLWAYRELISSSLNSKAPYKNDIACKLSQFERWMADLQQAFEAYDERLNIVWFGHLGDGNVHINVLKPDDMNEECFLNLHKKLDKQLVQICQQYRASISAEHGIGLLKKSLLPYGRSETEICLYKQIKNVFDPQGILNPGKIFD